MKPAAVLLPLASVLAQPEASSSRLPAAQHPSKVRTKCLPWPSEFLLADFLAGEGMSSIRIIVLPA